ncbi:GNAT family N-acetyltransferase [Vibrio hangzhouensis]|uniref:GNAT family N-acetyltransferase n=1 Tax=Vibrio hangzhouensis TaxID=462991 RepID=UPI001C941779|nr:GNAT family N-acetyltransferase [Vibrio hangzhouensis]MBY6196624.1 GNAT family N-acetyltransferase [Vibrio hangzhouensis]
MFEIRQVESSQLPLDLLMTADPEGAAIKVYQNKCVGYAAYLQEALVAGLLVAVDEERHGAEIFNISVYPQYQGKGFGGELLAETLLLLSRQGIECVELGTGCFGYQLAFYHKHGFRVDRVVKNFFLENYSEPIIENGIQHKDMLRLIWRSTEQREM